ncbi:MAG TPA: tRNA lysidine(34) synthetase TilS [Casimicrobiaceae bacterium]|nr:tRNA lysidine(34) synthetase TilS [Casimicrobiaceae bacterium]
MLAAVRDALRDAVVECEAKASARPEAAHSRVVVALSGGRDSIVLLDALAQVAPDYRVALSAMHVNHGISANAAAWAAFCAAECARRSVPLVVHHVRVERRGRMGLEAAARAARYAALATAEADFIALAHQADDQAETLLLQLMRGAGPHGLAAMPSRSLGGYGPILVRPFLRLPRSAIDAYARDRGLAWVDDESNADTDVKRNFIRHEIAGRLAAAFPGYPATLARSAAHQAEAARLLDELAQLDAEGAICADAVAGPALDRAALVALDARAPHRARNLLRWFLRRHARRPPSTARLAAMLQQLVHARPDARVRLVHGGAEIGIHRGRIVVHPPAIGTFEIAWNGETRVGLPHGTLEFAEAAADGTHRAALPAKGVTIRGRIGGERIQLGTHRQPRALKRILQETGMPFWLRDSLPLVFCGDALAVVPGVGVAAEFRAPRGTAGYRVNWHPLPPGD